MTNSRVTGTEFIFGPDAVQALITNLRNQGFRVIGPRVRDDAVVFAEITDSDQFPLGWQDEQAPGRYRLEQSDSPAFFGVTVGPGSFKRYLLPPRRKLWEARQDSGDIVITRPNIGAERYAFFGLRPCDLAALARLDRVLLEGSFIDLDYRERRASAVVIAVNCTRAANTCFCTTLGTGPQATTGFDLALTEIVGDGTHHFVAQVGSQTGVELVESLAAEAADELAKETAKEVVAATARSMGRRFAPEDLRDGLRRRVEAPQWEEVGARCQGCGSCTAVCPTCFCHTFEDRTDLGGNVAERWRRQDSCFSVEFSYIHGGEVRPSAYARYRHWMSHKFATWWDQFGSPGCVGCGRCVSWCPVGIDITAEAASLLDRDDRYRNA